DDAVDPHAADGLHLADELGAAVDVRERLALDGLLLLLRGPPEHPSSNVADGRLAGRYPRFPHGGPVGTSDGSHVKRPSVPHETKAYPSLMERARVVLVTNVGQGFGRAVSLAYGRAGYHVVCADRDVDLASKTAAEVEELGGQAIPIQADMTTQMDVLTTFQKVLEIFGALGGVVHVAEHVNTTPFENMAEAEFFEVLVEDVRSSFLVLKTAARLLSVGWVVIVAPPALGAVQMHTVQGALARMVTGFRERFKFPRANLVVPSRLSSDPLHDQALVRAVRYLGS